jgi:hypothetical protein
VALGKELFAECPKKNTRQRIWHSAKSQIPIVIDEIYDTHMILEVNSNKTLWMSV